MAGKRKVVNYPAISNGAVEWLEEHLTSDMRMFEWGSGGSTIFFAERVLKIISVEHANPWYVRVRDTLVVADLTERCDLYYLPPEELPLVQQLTKREVGNQSAIPGSCLSRHFPKHTFKNYVVQVNAYPDEFFDLVFVDGRARPSCVLHAIPKIRPGGFLVLDDAARKVYATAMNLLEGWDVLIFRGPAPLRHPHRDIRTTSVWTKPGQKVLNEGSVS